MSYVESLNPQQRQAVLNTRGPVLILAGAGTGKTRVITARIAHLIGQGVDPGQILAVTFTNKAAREMKERVSRLVKNKRADSKQSRPTISTFHSLGVRILRQHIQRLGYKPNFVIYDDSDQLGLVRKLLSHLSVPGTAADARDLLAQISRVKNKLGVAAATDDAVLARVLPKYESGLRACNAVDFDDLVLLPLRLLETEPDVLAACRERYRYIMVDEYQDTNQAQFRLIHLLSCEHRNLCVVGDDDQSIYGWRGAEIANLLDLETYYKEVKIIKLEQNYRSTNTILEAANALIRHNVRRRPKQLWSDKGRGGAVRLFTCENDEAEARMIVEEIEAARLGHRIPWGAQAVLFRTNQQSRPLEIALRQAGVRYRVVGGQSYFDRREVRDVMAYLRACLNPHDDISLLRIANVPARGLSDPTLERLLGASQAHQCSVYSAMEDPAVLNGLLSRTAAAVKAFTDLMGDWRARLSAAGALQPWAKDFFARIAYFDDLRKSEKDKQAGENRVRNLEELLISMDSQEAERGGLPAERLQDFLEDLSLDRDRASEDDVDRSTVTLITMHSCKGLEFPHVYLAGLEDGLVPHARSKLENTLDEERRLLYVAMTRAMESLTLSYCLGRRRYGSVDPCLPSPFLKELPPELLEPVDLNARVPVKAGAGANHFAAMRQAATTDKVV